MQSYILGIVNYRKNDVESAVEQLWCLIIELSLRVNVMLEP